MKKAVILVSMLACIFLSSCGKGDDPEPDKPVIVDPDPDPAPPTPPSANFISFKYGGTAYEIRGDNLCLFSRYGEGSFKITGNDPAAKNAFAISIEREIEKGSVFDIYTSSPYLASAISILFSSGEAITERSFSIKEIGQIDKIGQLIITEKTANRLSGTFSCRMMNGEITDGQFSVKEKE
jgi:hypothetical protein